MKRLNFPVHTWLVIFALAVFLFGVTATSTAQVNGTEDLESFLEGLSKDAATKYVAPIVTAFGTNLNGGWFHKAPSAKMFGLDIEFGLVGMGTFYPKGAEYLNFSTSGSFRFNTPQARELVTGLNLPLVIEDALVAEITNIDFTVGISGPTIIGDSETAIEIDFSGADITFIDPTTGLSRTQTVGAMVIPLKDGAGNPIGGFAPLADLSFLPLAAPQASIGTILGTRATFRYLPSITISEELGKFEYFGFGIQHNPGVLLPIPLPIDVSVGYFTQTLKIGTLFEAKTKAYGLNASKKLGVGPINITPYGGLMFEKTTIDVAYTFFVDDQEIDIAFELEGENKSRLTFGLSLRLLIFNINADYNIGKYNSVTVGVMFTI